jgi:CRISPR-associated protein Cas1
MIGRPMHVIGDGCVLARRGGRLVVHRDGDLRASAPLTMVGEVVVTGNVTVTTAAITAMLRNDIPLVFLSGTGQPLGRLEPPTAPHIAARLRQLDRHRDERFRLGIARPVIAAKIANQAVLLRRRARRAAEPAGVWTAVSRLAELEHAAELATSVPTLLGIEGAAAGAYFRAIRTLTAPELRFANRDRAHRDVVNQLLNYCSALLRETVIAALLAAGLDPYLSFLHVPARGRPTLAFDLMEEWRPVLLESTVLALLGLGSVTPDDLTADALLSADATAAAVARFQARLAAPGREWPVPPGHHTYRDLIHRQALRLRAVLLDETPTYQAFHWR